MLLCVALLTRRVQGFDRQHPFTGGPAFLLTRLAGRGQRRHATARSLVEAPNLSLTCYSSPQPSWLSPLAAPLPSMAHPMAPWLGSQGSDEPPPPLLSGSWSMPA